MDVSTCRATQGHFPRGAQKSALHHKLHNHVRMVCYKDGIAIGEARMTLSGAEEYHPALAQDPITAFL